MSPLPITSRRAAGLALIAALLASVRPAWSQGPLGAVRAESVASRVEATAGSEVMIGPDGPFPPGTSFRWTQVEGPPISVSDRTSAKIRFIAPAGTGQVAWQLTVRSDGDEKTSRIAVPIAPASNPLAAAGSPPGSEGPELTADAGDDQLGLVGRKITLNGTRSRPVGRVGYRWLQVAGPAVAALVEDKGYLSFEPTAPGEYRFALLVAGNDQISTPDFVGVEVGLMPVPRLAANSQPASMAPAAPLPGLFVASESANILRLAVAAAAALSTGSSTGSQVADVLEAIADRMPLYKTFGELQSELGRRLDVIVPSAPTLRAAWSSQVFVPLSQILGSELVALGIDPRASESSPGLDPSQRSRLQSIFRNLAGAFRARTVKD